MQRCARPVALWWIAVCQSKWYQADIQKVKSKIQKTYHAATTGLLMSKALQKKREWLGLVQSLNNYKNWNPTTYPIATLKPLPSCPTTFSFGTLTSSNETALVSLARWPMFFSFLPNVRPFESPSTMKPVNAFEVETFGSGFVLAKTKYQFATPPFEILERDEENVIRLLPSRLKL